MKTWLGQHRDAFLAALRRLTAAPLNTLLSLLAIGIALALPAAGQMLMSNAMQLARSANPTPQISVFMALDAGRDVVRSTEALLKKNDAVRSVQFVSRDDTLARMRTSAGLADVLEALQRNPFPDAFIVIPADDGPDAMEALAAELRHLAGVEHVQLDSAWARRLDALLRLGRTAVNLLAGFLGIGLVAITFNTIRLQVLTHQAEIEVSRLLGATDQFISRPFYYFGLLQGLLGGVVAWLIVFAATMALRGPVTELAQLYALNFNLHPLDSMDSVLLLCVAAILGWTGSVLSLRQHMGKA